MKYSVRLFFNRIGRLEFGSAARIAWEQIGYLLFQSRSYYVFHWDMQKKPPDDPVPEHFEIQQVPSWGCLSEQEQNRICQAEFRSESFFDEEAELWIGRYQKELASFVWVWPRKSIQEWFFSVPSDSLFFNHCFTFPEYRGHGFYYTMLREVLRIKIAQGFTHLFIHCYTWNYPSLHGIRKAGFVLLGTGRKKRGLPMQWKPCLRSS
jgi:RimJ/RimL family protein N-acetyltransferase